MVSVIIDGLLHFEGTGNAYNGFCFKQGKINEDSNCICSDQHTGSFNFNSCAGGHGNMRRYNGKQGRNTFCRAMWSVIIYSTRRSPPRINMLEALDGVGELLPSSVPCELYATAFYADVEYILVFDAYAITSSTKCHRYPHGHLGDSYGCDLGFQGRTIAGR